jgi:hypothetical protein
MRVHYSLLLCVFAAAVAVAACGESNPIASQGTNTQYDLQLDSVTPNPLTVAVGKTVAFKVWVSDVNSGLTVKNAAPAIGVIGSTKIATVVNPTNANLTTSVKGVAAGATTLSVSYLNVNTGVTLNAPAPVPVTVTP